MGFLASGTTRTCRRILRMRDVSLVLKFFLESKSRWKATSSHSLPGSELSRWRINSCSSSLRARKRGWRQRQPARSFVPQEWT